MQATYRASQCVRVAFCGCLLLLITAWATPGVAQAGLSPQEELRLVDSRIQFLQWLIDRYETGDCYLFADVTHGGFIRPMPKDEVVMTVTVLVMTGEIPTSKIQSVLALFKEISDKALEAVRDELTVLRQERQRLAGGQPLPPTTPAAPDATTPAQRTGRGFWQLKEGYPKIANTNNNTAVETVESSVSPTAISYHYIKKKYSGEVEHDCTMAADFADLGQATREANEEFTFTLQASWSRGKDNGLFDGKVPYLERNGGVTVVKVDPLPAAKRVDEAAQIWVGRFADGKDFPTDRRTITVRMPDHGTECLYGVSIDPNHKVTWAYKWVD